MNLTGYISLGTNLGDRLTNIDYAIEKVNSIKLFDIIAISNIYESKPMYNINQDYYLNLVFQYSTSPNIATLLDSLQQIEFEMGRKIHRAKNSPRTIDLDILTFDNMIVSNDTITVPHPKINERLFVLLPLADIDAQFVIPGNNKDIISLINSIDNNNDVKLNKLINLEYVKALSYSD